MEAALHHTVAGRTGQYGDPVALASLVVSVAALAWGVYNDLKTRTPAPRAEVVQRHVRVRLSQTDQPAPGLSGTELEQVIHITVTEVLNAASVSSAEDDQPSHQEGEQG